MNNALEELSMALGKLRYNGVNLYDKEALQQISNYVNQMIDNLDEQCRGLYTMMSMMGENRTLGNCAEALQQAFYTKQAELQAWNDIQTTIKQLISY